MTLPVTDHTTLHALPPAVRPYWLVSDLMTWLLAGGLGTAAILGLSWRCPGGCRTPLRC